MELDLVSGSHGFIGHALVNKLTLQDNHLVAAVDRNLDWVQDNLPVSTVYHLASYGNLYDQQGKDKIYAVNVTHTNELLKKLESTNYQQFFFFSSSSVYGNHSEPMTEQSQLRGYGDYAKSKRDAEEVVKYFGDRHPMTIIRPFSVTGVGEQAVHLIPTLIRAALTGEEIVLDPTPVHDFVDIVDLLGALEVIKDHRAKDQRGWVVYNVGTGKQYSNLQVLQLLEEVLGKKLPYTPMTKLREYDTNTAWVSDSSRLQGLGWKPTKSLIDSIGEMVKDYKNGNTGD